MAENSPIFIGGLHRSGTSLVRAVVGSHHDIALFPWDLPLWTYFYPKYNKTPLTFSDIEKCVEEILKHEKMLYIQIEKDEILQRIRVNAGDKPANFGHVCSGLLEVYASNVGRKRWGLKNPLSELYFEDILRYFPNTKFVHVLRDPRDVAVSHRSKRHDPFGYIPLKHIMHWKSSYRLAQTNTNKHPGHYITIQYEKLVSEPNPVIEELSRFLGVEVTDSMRKIDNHRGWAGGYSSFVTKDEKPKETPYYTSSLGRFRTKMPPTLLWLYQLLLKNEIEGLEFEILPVNISFFHKAAFLAKSLAEYIYKPPLIFVKLKVYHFLLYTHLYQPYLRITGKKQ